MTKAKGKDNPLMNEIITTTDGKEKRSRATAAQVELRTQKVAQWLMDGRGRQEIIIDGQKAWGLSERMIENYITNANELIEYIGNKEIESQLAKNLHRLAKIYNSAFEENDWKSALDAIKTEARLLGLNSPEKLDTRITEVTEMTADQRADRIAELLKKADKRDPIKLRMN